MNASRPFQFSSPVPDDQDDEPSAASFAGTLRAFAARQQADPSGPRSAPGARIPQKPSLRAIGPGAQRADGPSSAKTGRTSETESIAENKPTVRKPPTQQTSPLITRAWGWLKSQNAFSAKKQLRVCETVSLGEKRFVAVVQIEGKKFLIGGGSSGVSLLAELDHGAELDGIPMLGSGDASEFPQPMACAGGRSR